MFSQTEENVWDKIFEINVKCSWLLAKEAYPELMKRGGGNIVFVSSIAAYNPMQVIYTQYLLIQIFYHTKANTMP